MASKLNLDFGHSQKFISRDTLNPRFTHRGEEVESSVIDGSKSVIWREALHRRTTIQAILYHASRGELRGN